MEGEVKYTVDVRY